MSVWNIHPCGWILRHWISYLTIKVIFLNYTYFYRSGTNVWWTGHESGAYVFVDKV